MIRVDEDSADDSRFHRLVDGELSDSQRRELLAGLDEEPDGWRRCALAFLTAQSWRHGLGAMGDSFSGGPPVVPKARPGARRRPAPASVWRHPATAASILVAFALGALLTEAWRGGEGDRHTPDHAVIAAQGANAPASGEAVVHVPPPSPGRAPDDLEVSRVIVAEDANSCCVTDLTGDVPLFYCFSKEPYAPIYFARLQPEP